MKSIYAPRIWVIALLVTFFLSPTVFAATTLRMSSWLPPTFPFMAEGLLPWAENIEKVTEGRVKVKILKKSVGSPPQQFDTAAKSLADITFGCHSYTPGRFLTHGFVELPGNGENAIATSIAYWRTYQKYLMSADEHNGVKLLSLFTHGPGILFTSGIKINSLSENKGIKIRGGGVAATRVVDTLNATSVAAPISKAAEMINNKVVDGIMLDAGSLRIFNFDKYMTYGFTVEGGLYNVSWFLVMNQKSWDKISPKDQKAIESISGEVLAKQVGAAWYKNDEISQNTFKEKKLSIEKASPELMTELDEKFKEYENVWIDSVKKYGIDGKAVIKAYRQEVKSVTQQL